MRLGDAPLTGSDSSDVSNASDTKFSTPNTGGRTFLECVNDGQSSEPKLRKGFNGISIGELEVIVDVGRVVDTVDISVLSPKSLVGIGSDMEHPS